MVRLSSNQVEGGGYSVGSLPSASVNFLTDEIAYYSAALAGDRKASIFNVPPTNRNRYYVIENDCESAIVASAAPIGSNTSGTGATSTVIAPWSPTTFGVISCSTGTNSAGRYAAIGNATNLPIQFGNGICYFQSRIRIPILSDATDSFIIRSGFNDSAGGVTSAGDGVDTAQLRYTHNVNGGNWQVVTRNNSGETLIDTGLAAAQNVIYRLETIINADATLAEFRINGTTVGVSNSNIPSTVGRDTAFHPISISKTGGSVGTNPRTVEVDYYQYVISLPNGRS